MILPYHEQQAAYFGLTAAILIAVWRLLRPLADSPLRRMLWCVGGFALLLVGFALFRGFEPGGSNLTGFLLIAFGYYGFGIVLPVLGLLEFRRSRTLAALSLVVLGVALWAALVEPDRLQTRRESVTIARFAAGRPLRIAHVSDLQTVGHCGREDEAAAIVNAFEPDLIVFSGDYIAGPFGEPGPAMAAARRFLAALRARLGVVVVDGHAEPERLRREIFAGLDLVYLHDEEKVFELEDGRRLRVFGCRVHDSELDLIRPPADAAELAIVVSHMPDESPGLEGRGVDIHLAGHTHGGQIVIPGLGPPITLSALPRRYARGLHPFGDHLLNVNAGIGMEGNHAPRIRLFCPPEVCLLTVSGGAALSER